MIWYPRRKYYHLPYGAQVQRLNKHYIKSLRGQMQDRFLYLYFPIKHYAFSGWFSKWSVRIQLQTFKHALVVQAKHSWSEFLFLWMVSFMNCECHLSKQINKLLNIESMYAQQRMLWYLRSRISAANLIGLNIETNHPQPTMWCSKRQVWANTKVLHLEVIDANVLSVHLEMGFDERWKFS